MNDKLTLPSTDSIAAPTKLTSVVVIDDHCSIRQMLERLLLMDGHYQVVGDTGSGLEGLDLCRRLKPDVAVIDLLIPGMSGVELLQSVRMEGLPTRVLIYSGSLNETLVANAIAARPDGFVHKEDALTSLFEALKTVAMGGSYRTPFVNRLAEQVPSARSLLGQLTVRERTILQLVAEGHSSREIGVRLGLSSKTVEHYRLTMMQKLGVHDVAGLTRLAVRDGLVSND